MSAITAFRDEYWFLSNMFPQDVTVAGMKFKCAEAAFQALKCANLSDIQYLMRCGGPTAKRYGRTVPLVPNWETQRVDAMREVLASKFSEDGLALKLLATDTAELIEGNTWGDTFWGVCNGVGENMLGKLLMERRALLASGGAGR